MWNGGLRSVTVMNATIERGTPFVDDPDRVGQVDQLGVDETRFQAARPGRATTYVTVLFDLRTPRVIDMTRVIRFDLTTRITPRAGKSSSRSSALVDVENEALLTLVWMG